MATIRIETGETVFTVDAFEDFAEALIRALNDPDFYLDV